MKLKTLTAAAALVWIMGTGSTFAGELENLCSNIRAKSDNASGRFDAVVTCITKLAQELEARPKIPSDAVVAFDRPGQCPAGWAPFAEGQGRFILGASHGIDNNLFRSDELTPRKYRDHGGEERVKLTVPELPSHFHTIPKGGTDAAINQPLGRQLGVRRTNGPDETQATGKNESHNNMPPYIALYLCKKK